MNQKLLAFLSAILLLSSCAVNNDNTVISSSALEHIEQIDIYYVDNSGNHAKNVSDVFSRTLITSGFDINDTEIHRLQPGQTGFYLVDEMVIQEYSPLINELNMDFLFADYEHFTMSMNSTTVLSACEKELDAISMIPIAVFYCGSDYILSSTNIDDFGSFAGDLIDGRPSYDQDASPILLMNSPSERRKTAYEKAGSEVESGVVTEARFAALTDNELKVPLIAEFSDSESVDFSKIQLDGIFYTRPMINVKSVWLLVDKDYYSNMKPESKGAVLECLARTFPETDGKAIKAEKYSEDILTGNRAVKSRDFTKSRQSLYQLEQSPAEEHSYETKRIINYVNDLYNQK